MTPWLMTPVRRRVAPRPYRRQPCLSVSPKFVALRADFSTTDFFNHGWTRMDTDSVVLIRVYPWLIYFGCGLAALRCIAGCQRRVRGAPRRTGAGRSGSWEGCGRVRLRRDRSHAPTDLFV